MLGACRSGESRQERAQLGARVKHPRLYGIHGAVHDFANLLAGMALAVRQFQRQPLIGRELLRSGGRFGFENKEKSAAR